MGNLNLKHHRETEDATSQHTGEMGERGESQIDWIPLEEKKRSQKGRRPEGSKSTHGWQETGRTRKNKKESRGHEGDTTIH